MSDIGAQTNMPSWNSIASSIKRAQDYCAHPLHGSNAVWKQTNCYVDLWIEVLSSWGLNPIAALPFTITQDFEGDQFTFFKFPLEDLEFLFGIVVQEHAIFEQLDIHIDNQLSRGNMMLVEVDAWYLPDTKGTSYRQEHSKTTICVDAIDRGNRQLAYFHNSGYYLATDTDFDGLVGSAINARLPPYVECAKRRYPPMRRTELHEASSLLFRRHLRRRPQTNPITAFGNSLARDAKILASRPMSYFHAYSFNTLRQLGSNFELLGHYLHWQSDTSQTERDAFTQAISACNTISSEAMTLEFRLARACARGKAESGERSIEVIEAAYTSLIDSIYELFPEDAPIAYSYSPEHRRSISSLSR